MADAFSGAARGLNVGNLVQQFQQFEEAPLRKRAQEIRNESAQLRLSQQRRGEEMAVRQQEQFQLGVDSLNNSKGNPGFKSATRGLNWQTNPQDTLTATQRMNVLQNQIPEAYNEIRRVGLANGADPERIIQLANQIMETEGFDKGMAFINGQTKMALAGEQRMAEASQREQLLSGQASGMLADQQALVDFMSNPDVSAEDKAAMLQRVSQLASIQGGRGAPSAGGALSKEDQKELDVAEGAKQMVIDGDITQDQLIAGDFSTKDAEDKGAAMRFGGAVVGAQEIGALESGVARELALEKLGTRALKVSGKQVVDSPSPGNFTVNLVGAKDAQEGFTMLGAEGSNVLPMASVREIEVPGFGKKFASKVGDFEITPFRGDQFLVQSGGQQVGESFLRRHIQNQIKENKGFGNVTSVGDTDQTVRQLSADMEFLRKSVTSMYDKVSEGKQVLLDRAISDIAALEERVYPRGRTERKRGRRKAGVAQQEKEDRSRSFKFGHSDVSKNVAQSILDVYKIQSRIAQALLTEDTDSTLSTELPTP